MVQEELAVTFESLVTSFETIDLQLQTFDPYIFSNVISILLNETPISESAEAYSSDLFGDLAKRLSLEQIEELEYFFSYDDVTRLGDVSDLKEKMIRIKEHKSDLLQASSFELQVAEIDLENHEFTVKTSNMQLEDNRANLSFFANVWTSLSNTIRSLFS
ncbi:hypothetical protein BTR23_03790 [Alkalihalophilus pseudofirmus]|nr:hypothetical protein BTR23_03790 [Alkalihalophilus pseudofirmus]